MTVVSLNGAHTVSEPQSSHWIAITALVLTLLGMAFTGVSTYGNDSASLRERVQALETKEVDRDRRLERMEQKLDRILERERP